jgi:hypothetical protein
LLLLLLLLLSLLLLQGQPRPAQAPTNTPSNLRPLASTMGGMFKVAVLITMLARVAPGVQGQKIQTAACSAVANSFCTKPPSPGSSAATLCSALINNCPGLRGKHSCWCFGHRWHNHWGRLEAIGGQVKS